MMMIDDDRYMPKIKGWGDINESQQQPPFLGCRDSMTIINCVTVKTIIAIITQGVDSSINYKTIASRNSALLVQTCEPDTCIMGRDSPAQMMATSLAARLAPVVGKNQ